MPATTQKPTAVENITVLQVGKYGVRVDEKNWFGVNEPIIPSNFVPNRSYKVGVVVSKTGKKYISEILGVEESSAAPAVAAPAASAPAPAATPAPRQTVAKTSDHPVRSGFGTPLTDYDVAIQRQISRAGIYQAALNSPALAQWAINVDEYLALVRTVADAGMKYIQE